MVAAGPAVATVRGKERTKMDFFWEMLSLQETLFLLILLGVLIKKLKIVCVTEASTRTNMILAGEGSTKRGQFSTSRLGLARRASWVPLPMSRHRTGPDWRRKC